MGPSRAAARVPPLRAGPQRARHFGLRGSRNASRPSARSAVPASSRLSSSRFAGRRRGSGPSPRASLARRTPETGSACADPLGELDGASHCVAGRHDVVEQPDAVGASGIDRVAREEHLERHREGHEAGEPRGCARSLHQPHLTSGAPEAGRLVNRRTDRCTAPVRGRHRSGHDPGRSRTTDPRWTELGCRDATWQRGPR